MMGQKAAGPVMALVVTMSLLGGSLAQANQTRSLEAFSNIYACVPFTATVDPGDGYSVSISAEQAVTDAILTTVKDGNLYLESGSFDSSQPIEVSISLPASELKSVNHYGQLSGLFVSPGEVSETAGRSMSWRGRSRRHVGRPGRRAPWVLRPRGAFPVATGIHCSDFHGRLAWNCCKGMTMICVIYWSAVLQGSARRLCR